MKRTIIYCCVLMLPFLILTNVWAADDATIAGLQNEVQNLKGGLPAEQAARIAADNDLQNQINNIELNVDTNAGTICNAGEYLDGDGTCKTLIIQESIPVVGIWQTSSQTHSFSGSPDVHWDIEKLNTDPAYFLMGDNGEGFIEILKSGYYEVNAHVFVFLNMGLWEWELKQLDSSNSVVEVLCRLNGQTPNDFSNCTSVRYFEANDKVQVSIIAGTIESSDPNNIDQLIIKKLR